MNRAKGEHLARWPRTRITLLDEDIDGWDEMTEQERERVRAMLRDLGLEETDDPDVFE